MALHTSGLARDLEVLELLGSEAAWQEGGFGVQQISEKLQRDKGQISRVCQTLHKVGLINRDRLSRQYTLGHHLYALAMRTQEAHLALLARPTLLELMAQAEESAHLTVLRGGAIMTVHTELAQHPERDDSFDGCGSPAYGCHCRGGSTAADIRSGNARSMSLRARRRTGCTRP